MAKVSKENLTKAEIKALMAWRRKQKEEKKAAKAALKRRENISRNISDQPNTVVDEADVKLVRPEVLPTEPKRTEVDPFTNVAFVLGNGTSRQSIEPASLRPHGKIYGCNALYRTFDPDYLVAVDVKMILELHKAGYHLKNNNIWTNPQKSIINFPNFNFFKPSKGWSSGPTALWLASQHRYDTIYILGFDYKGLGEGAKFNNIYADTPNYKKSTDSATFFGNWMRQTTNVIKEHQNINYIRIITPDNYRPDELNKFNNFSTMLVEDFQKLFNLK